MPDDKYPEQIRMTLKPHEVWAPPLSPNRFEAVLEPNDWAEFRQTLASSVALLDGRAVWNVNSTAQGGGVAEMLRSFTSYSRGAGLDMRWMAIEGTPEFFAVTKRLHNFLHGEPGDGGELGAREREVYEAVTLDNAEELAVTVRAAGHRASARPADGRSRESPQGLRRGRRVAQSRRAPSSRTSWCDAAWDFLEPYLEEADACVFSRHAYVPGWAVNRRTMVIQPSIDAFSPKNQDMDDATALAILGHVGLLGAGVPQDVTATFTRYDGSPGRVDRRCDIISTGPPPGRGHAARHPGLAVGPPQGPRGCDARLRRARMRRHGGAPRAGRTQRQRGHRRPRRCRRSSTRSTEAWRALPHERRARVQLACLPMADIDENAAIVNALQRHSAIVVQKSIQEGFGLTVAEAMWKSRAVVATAVGGIRDQVTDGETGVLLDDPHDLRAVR